MKAARIVLILSFIAVTGVLVVHSQMGIIAPTEVMDALNEGSVVLLPPCSIVSRESNPLPRKDPRTQRMITIMMKAKRIDRKVPIFNRKRLPLRNL